MCPIPPMPTKIPSWTDHVALPRTVQPLRSLPLNKEIHFASAPLPDAQPIITALTNTARVLLFVIICVEALRAARKLKAIIACGSGSAGSHSSSEHFKSYHIKVTVLRLFHCVRKQTQPNGMPPSGKPAVAPIEWQVPTRPELIDDA